MRKLFTLIAASAMVLGANAQGYEGNKFFDNWSFGVEGGVTTATTARHQMVGSNKAWKQGAFFGGMRAIAGAELTKQIVPAFGIAVQDHAAFNWTDSKTVVDYNDLVVLAKLNFMNFFGGYKGTPRTFELEGVFGGGWRYYFNKNANYINNSSVNKYEKTDGTGRNNWIAKAGLNLLFNLGESKAWTIAVKPAIVWDLDYFSYRGDNPYNGARFNMNQSNIELMAGVTYHFKSSNGAHHFTVVTPRDQAEIDGLNARINDLRGQLADKDSQLDAANRQIADLQNQLNDCRNQKPVVKVKEETNRLMESAVTFRQGKSVIDASQMPNVERVAIYLKNHSAATATIKGYASPEGSLDLNQRLAEARANAVKTMLVNKYKIAAKRLTAEGQGIGKMFSEPEWNRVAISTIDEK